MYEKKPNPNCNEVQKENYNVTVLFFFQNTVVFFIDLEQWGTNESEH